MTHTNPPTTASAETLVAEWIELWNGDLATSRHGLDSRRR